MNLEEQIKELIGLIDEKIIKEEKIRDENLCKHDYDSNKNFYTSYGKINAYCWINLKLNEVLKNGK